MAAFDDVVIISGCRTPVGKFQGSLSDLSATQLGAIVVREAVKRANLDPKQVDECIMGNVVSAGLGQNPARQAAIFGGLAPEVGAMTVNKVCGSGLKAVALATQAIQTENSSVVVAGGMESMTNAPYLLPQARKGYRLGNAQIVDSMVNDGLWDIYDNYHMGITGENVAEKYGITREEQDEFAVNSHRKAVAAIKECRFKSQIVPVELPPRKKGEAPVIFDKDESPREDTTIELLRSLKPAFKKDGTVTAGNAPGVNDGAAAVVVTSARQAKALGAKPMVRIVAQATSGVEPKFAHHTESLHRKCLVQFVQVHVFILPAGLLPNRADRTHRSHHDPFGFDSAGGLCHDPDHGLGAEFFRLPGAGDHDSGRAIVHPGRIASGDRTVFLERWL